MAEVRKEFRIQILRHKHSNLLLAISPDHKGINVAARSEDQLRDELRIMLKALLEAEGKQVISVETMDTVLAPRDEFEVGEFTANAQLAA